MQHGEFHLAHIWPTFGPHLASQVVVADRAGFLSRLATVHGCEDGDEEVEDAEEQGEVPRTLLEPRQD